MIHLTETWRMVIDCGKFVAVAFIDFRKAFDSVPHATLLGTFRSDYEHEYEYEFFNVYPARMPDCVRLSRQLVLSSKSRRRLDTNYEIFNKSRPPTTSLLQVQRRVKRLVFKRVDTLKCSVQLVSQCFGDFVASCVVCLLNTPLNETTKSLC